MHLTPGWTGGYYAFMRGVLASERGGELYGRRQPMIEPVFGQTNTTAAWAASTGAAEAPSGPNGGSSPPPTTSGDETGGEGSGRGVRARG